MSEYYSKKKFEGVDNSEDVIIEGRIIFLEEYYVRL
jgi:hypothetical protein